MIPQTFDSKSFLEKKIILLEEYRRGENLRTEQLKLSNPKDYWIVAYLENLREEYLPALDSTFSPSNLENFKSLLSQWLKDETYFLGEQLQHQPELADLVFDMQRGYQVKKCKLFYVLLQPDTMQLTPNMREREKSIAEIFLTRAEFIGNRRYRSLFFPEQLAEVA